MTKQEAIRERAINDLMIYKSYDRLPCEHIVDCVSKSFHSQGVVIKVERELPCAEYSPLPTMDEGYNKGHKQGFKCGVMDELDIILKAGYVAVEPLIKEVK